MGCPKGPDVTVCISDPLIEGFQCIDKENNSYELLYSESANYVCFPPQDARALFEFCALKGSNDL